MKYIKLYLVLGLSLIFGSCEEFLKEEPTGSLTTESDISSYDAGVAFATGAYRALPRWTDGSSEWGGNLAGSREYATGKAASQYMGARLWKFEADDNDGQEDYFTYPWDRWYQGVRDCNLSIKMIPTITGLSLDDQSRLLGEVRTLRSFYYFCLVRFYGDVPYNVEVLLDVSQAEQPRSSLKKIYDEIIVPDLEFAVNESKLPDGRSSGRVTRDVARVVLADVYLTMAGYPYQEVNTDPTKNWCEEGLWSMTEYPVNSASAKDLLQKSKTQLDYLYGKYPIGAFSDINNPAMNNKNGAIFQIQYLAGTTDLPINYYIPMTSYTSAFTTETGTNIPSIAYHASFNPADKRIQDRVYFYYSDTKAKKYDVNESPADKFPQPFLYKYYDYDAVKNTARSGLNYNLYRYADVLLMLTEVNWSLRQLGVTVSPVDIQKGINEVRVRAGLPEIQAGDLTLKDIMSERAYELIFENKMLWDMRRTRKALKDGAGEFTALQNFIGHQPTSFDHQFSNKHLLSPVSANEIKNNRKCSQNFSWQPVQQGQ
ncbi:MAG TPA: RagB/SusD family nutrient uptake outer membrane protein [Draconibacterium sp.]|nr:RagB/SusD family nutrient uptake outer membrane protein [Draconibacterium sp.]